jgi:hypothetical protein
MGRGTLLIGVAVIAAALAPAQSALASSGDAAATSSYLKANYALLKVAQRNIKASEAAYKSVQHRTAGECPRAGLSSPQDTQSTQMSNEVIGAMVVSAAKPDLAAIRTYLSAVGRLHWKSATINRSIGRYRAMLGTIFKLSVPDLCTDVKSWATSGFQTLPSTTISFVKLFLPNWVALGLIPAGLKPLEDAEGRSIASRSHAIEVQITDVEARAVETWGDIMNELLLEP